MKTVVKTLQVPIPPLVAAASVRVLISQFLFLSSRARLECKDGCLSQAMRFAIHSNSSDRLGGLLEADRQSSGFDNSPGLRIYRPGYVYETVRLIPSTDTADHPNNSDRWGAETVEDLRGKLVDNSQLTMLLLCP